jgi:hypothetical protein
MYAPLKIQVVHRGRVRYIRVILWRGSAGAICDEERGGYRGHSAHDFTSGGDYDRQADGFL